MASSDSDNDYPMADDKRATTNFSDDDDYEYERKRKSTHRRTRANGIVHGKEKPDATR